MYASDSILMPSEYDYVVIKGVWVERSSYRDTRIYPTKGGNVVKVLTSAVLVVVLFITIGVAQREKQGIGGTVYDQLGSPAGSDLDTIYI
jgi:hypothetical protein